MLSTNCVKPKAVVLLSGGLDSATCMAIARQQGYALYAISFRYGQRHLRELDMARKLAAHFGAQQHIVVDFDMRSIGGSALVDTTPIPKQRTLEEIKNAGIPPTYVPARNTIFLAFALAWAEVLDAHDIFIGVNAIDCSGYPDCTPQFIESFCHVARDGTRAGTSGSPVRIHAPLINMTKAHIIRTGHALGVDFTITHSCYDPTPDGKACGQCDSCVLRKKGFEEAGLSDPIAYAHDS